MKKLFYLLSVAGIALVACNKQMNDVAALDEGTRIVFTNANEFGFATRATPVTTDNISTIYVNATTGTSNETAVFTSAEFTKSGSDWSGDKYWPETNPNYHFYVANVALTHTAGGATVSPANANTDIVVDYVASPTFKQKTSVQLEHIFAQVGTVAMKAPEGYAVTNMKVTLQPVTSGTFNLKSDQWTTRGNAGSATYIFGSASSGITVSSESNNATYTGPDNDLWLVPGQYTLTASYTISRGAYSKTVNGATCTVTLVQGKNNNIGPTVQGGVDIPNIPVPTDIAEITFGVTVTDWNDNHVDANF